MPKRDDVRPHSAHIRSALVGAHYVAPAVVLSAAAGLVLLVAVGRLLTPPAYSVFMGFWGLMFGIAAVPVGIEQEATRLLPISNERDRSRVWRALLRASFGLLATLLVLEPSAFPALLRVLHGSLGLYVLLVLATVGFVCQFLVRGLVRGWAGCAHTLPWFSSSPCFGWPRSHCRFSQAAASWHARRLW